MGAGMGRRSGRGDRRIFENIQLSHFTVQQKLTQHFKAIIFKKKDTDVLPYIWELTETAPTQYFEGLSFQWNMIIGGEKKITSEETPETQSCLPKKHLDYQLGTRNFLESAGKDFGDAKRKADGVVRQEHARGGSMKKAHCNQFPRYWSFSIER